MIMFFVNSILNPKPLQPPVNPKKIAMNPDPKEFIGSSESVACIDLFSFLRKYSDVALVFLEGGQFVVISYSLG